VWSQFFEPHLVIVVQTPFIVIDKHTRSNVHRRYKGQYPLCGIPLSYP
jgi:predicted restriction endonuclease